MKLFRSYTYTWWQIGIFKLSLLSFGVAIGAYWHEFFGAGIPALLGIGAVSALYTWYVSLSQ